MRRSQAIGKLYGQFNCSPRWHPRGCNSLPQSLTFEQLRDDVVDSVRVTNVVDGNNILMVERRDGSRLLLKPPQPVGIIDKESGKDFESNVTQQPCIARAIHLTHAARTDQ